MEIAKQQTNMAVGQPFNQALIWLKSSRKVVRRGWNGKGMFVYYVPERTLVVDGANEETRPLLPYYGEGHEILYAAKFDMQYANGKVGIWSPTPEDLVSEDWGILQ